MVSRFLVAALCACVLSISYSAAQAAGGAKASGSKSSEARDPNAPPPATLKDAHVVAAWARAAREGENTHVFITVENKAASPIFVKGGTTDAARAVQLVRFKMLGAFLRTTLVDPVLVDPHGRYVFEPGVIALELRDLNRNLEKGDRLPMTVEFAQLGEIPVEVEVDSSSAVRYEEPPPDAVPEGKGGGGH